ncbi:MAG: carbamoyltransferase HypF [Elusimicrobia bacterium]|nr:carbamoyltransferase HypF [Elusimicrobiota bacterium]
MAAPARRLWVLVRGAVQGVGFRPFVFRLARELGLNGWVNNSAQGVTVEAEGPTHALEAFLARLVAEKPPNSVIEGMEHAFLDPVPYASFEIRKSEPGGRKTALVLPDIAPCAACLAEVFDQKDRRHRYPFTNCTHCGPRFSIIEGLPYDRPNTAMRGFRMCEACRKEYEDPADRRFHAQPNACPACGPQVELWDPDGKVRSSRDEALKGAVEALARGLVVAVKGVGGFHLMADARSDAAVKALRARKHREEKPFAVMFPTLEALSRCARIRETEARILSSPEAPIVLLALRPGACPQCVSRLVAPGNPNIGAMLPSTPLHHVLLHDLASPVVATSGNLSEEPICTDERDALSRLAGIADLFLVHDRPISRHVDDSIVRVLAGRPLLLRRARGYAPMPVRLRPARSGRPGGEPAPTLLAVGGHLKNTVAVSVADGIHLSQHIGDLESAGSYEAFERVIESLSKLYDLKPGVVARDSHPDYVSTRHAGKLGLPVVPVQHHVSHVLACMADNELEGPVLGVAWDGTGYGPDQTVWGGEFLRVWEKGWARAAHWRTFPLPGGDRAVREMRRSAFGLLFEVFGEALLEPDGVAPGVLRSFSVKDRRLLLQMCRTRTNAPLTSSVGRLFDAVACLAGLRDLGAYEGQAAMELEYAAAAFKTEERYPFALTGGRKDDGPSPVVLDWEPMVRAIIRDRAAGTSAGEVAAKFHNSLAEAIVGIARSAGLERVALSGGCFQNRYLTERAVERLSAEGFRPYRHQRVPPNDGSNALGQAVAASWGWKDASQPFGEED